MKRNGTEQSHRTFRYKKLQNRTFSCTFYSFLEHPTICVASIALLAMSVNEMST